MKFLVPDNYTYIEQPIYIEGDRYLIDKILITPIYNVIYATCRQHKKGKCITLSFNHQNGNYENVKATYFASEYNVGDFFIDFKDGYWYGIIKAEIYKDDKGYWQVVFLMKNKDNRWKKLKENNLFKKIEEHKLKYAFTNQEKIKDYSKTIDEQISKIRT